MASHVVNQVRAGSRSTISIHARRLDPPHQELLKTTGFAPYVQDECWELFHGLFPSYSMAMDLHITENLSYLTEVREERLYCLQTIGKPCALPNGMRVAYRRAVHSDTPVGHCPA